MDFNDVTKDASNVFWGLKPEEQPLRPEAVAIVKQRAKLGTPYSRCLPNGIPAGIFVLAFKMIQASQEIVILFEGGDPPRQIHTDGRSLPRDPCLLYTSPTRGIFNANDIRSISSGTFF